jgi:uncharacterized protein Yka (UPF0111/DUF47 family)
VQNSVVALWHRLIGKDDKFFALLQAGADEARTSVDLFTRGLRALCEGRPAQFSDIAASRRRQKQIRADTIAELNTTLVAPFEREDIQALAYALYRIPKAVEKIGERMAIFPGDLPCGTFMHQAELLATAAQELVLMIRLLRPGVDVTQVSAANARLQTAEGEADQAMLELLQEFSTGAHSAKELVIVHSLNELIERAVDRCRNAGNIVLQIALKNT